MVSDQILVEKWLTTSAIIFLLESLNAKNENESIVYGDGNITKIQE